MGQADKARLVRHKICEVLIEAGANPNFCKPETKMTPLHFLAFNDDFEAVKTLLENGADW